jgi:hypothetical protein
MIYETVVGDMCMVWMKYMVVCEYKRKFRLNMVR